MVTFDIDPELAIPVIGQPQTFTLDHMATNVGTIKFCSKNYTRYSFLFYVTLMLKHLRVPVCPVVIMRGDCKSKWITAV